MPPCSKNKTRLSALTLCNCAILNVTLTHFCDPQRVSFTSRNYFSPSRLILTSSFSWRLDYSEDACICNAYEFHSSGCWWHRHVSSSMKACCWCKTVDLCASFLYLACGPGEVYDFPVKFCLCLPEGREIRCPVPPKHSCTDFRLDDCNMCVCDADKKSFTCELKWCLWARKTSRKLKVTAPYLIFYDEKQLCK